MGEEAAVVLTQLYQIPLWIGMPLFALAFVGLSWVAIILLRRWVHSVSDSQGEWDRVLGYAVAVYGVLYGVTLAMIAAGAWANFTEVEDLVLKEASSVAVLYRDASGLPDPLGDDIQALLVQYTHQVIDQEWPVQASGELPADTVDEVDAIQEALFTYEPATYQQIALYGESISAFNALIADRRARIAVTDLALPPVLWAVLGVGAALTIVLLALIDVRRIRTHFIMSGMIAAFVGLLIFAIAGFDHPYAGPISVTPHYFETLVDDLFDSPR